MVTLLGIAASRLAGNIMVSVGGYCRSPGAEKLDPELK